MVFFNYSTMQMAAKVVYYGPGLCGKTTNLHWIYNRTAAGSRGEMVSLETETDRTLFFDLLPIDVGQVAGFSTRIQLYTVPGQVFYNTTRKLVLKGVDGVVFVADSQRAMLEANVDSFKNLEENLAEMGLTVNSLPLVLQYNKRDLADILTTDELDASLNRGSWPSFEAVALRGGGVFETLKGISRQTLLSLRERLTRGDSRRATPARTAPAAGPVAGPAPAPAAPRAAAPPAAQPAPPAAPAARATAVAPPPETAPEPAPPAAPVRHARRRVDVEDELDRLRRGAPHPLTTPTPRPGATVTNGHRELARDLKLTLKRTDFERARRLTLSFQVEDGDRQVVDSVQGLAVDLGEPGSLAKVLLKLNIALQAKE